MVDVMGDNLKANPVAGETRWASSSTDAQQVGAEHLTSDVPGLAEIFKMVWYPKVLESLSPTHRFLILQGCAYTGAGLVFMVSPWLGTILLTFGQLKADPCPPRPATSHCSRKARLSAARNGRAARRRMTC